MLNGDKSDIRCQRSNSDRDKIFFNQVALDCDFPSLSWRNIRPDLSIMNNSHMLCDVNISNDTYLCQNSINNNNKQEFIQVFNDDKVSIIKEDESITQQKTKLKPPNFYKPKIKTMKIKSLVSNETLSNLPFEVHQHLISLLPDCDKVFSGQTPDEKCLSPSKTALNNEFFNKALMRFLWKLTNGKSVLSTESFISRIKNYPATIRSIGNSGCDADESTQKPKIREVPQSNSSTIRLDYDINDAKVNYNFGVESPTFLTNGQFENQLNLKRENEAGSPSGCFDGSFLFNVGTCTTPLNTSNNSEFETIEREFVDIFTNTGLQAVLSPISDSVITAGSSKYKRRNSGDSLAPTPNKRPTRSTAGQLPARLKSSSPQPGAQGQIISPFLNGSQSPTSNKSIVSRKKNKEKRKYKSTEYNNCSAEIKPTSFHNDTILLNLRTKLSNRIHKNLLKDYQDHSQAPQSKPDFSSDINCFDSKSPRSISPESDKLTYINSPLSKSGQNHFRHLKYRNPYFENQTPTSPQWSFSSEFTSQSSVESVLSQKNIRIDCDDVTITDNLLDDMDSEEMPPPRRTLTVAAMREKMRAKKMAKEEKRKDCDKDFSFDMDKIEDQKHTEQDGDHCQNSVMSAMINMPRDNDDNEDDNIANDFDSFLIDDYQVEIDDKILNYSDDLDDLLLSGGNESLLEIIMKDPDAMDIANESFCSMNNDLGPHPSHLVSSDHTQCSFSNANIQSQCSIYDNHSSNMLTATHTTLQKPCVPVSSVCSIDNSILSQALTSVIQKVETEKTNLKDSSSMKSALQNAYLVDGNGLSDALKLIQSLNPGAKVTTQQFFLVNSGPQLVLSQAPPAQATCHPTVVQSAVKSTPITSNLSTPTTTSNITSNITKSESNNKISNPPSSLIFTNTKPSTTFNQAPVMSSTLSVLPQFSAFNNKQSNVYSLNSNNFTNKVVNNIQYQSTTTCSQQNTIFTTQKPLTSNQNPQNTIFGTQKPLTSNQTSQNTIGIRLQLAPNFQNTQHLNIIQPSQNHVIPMMNQSLQFISPQHNNNISLITQTQPMQKLVLLYPNLNCSQLSTDPIKNDSQQIIFLSQKEQPTPISLSTGQTFQVLNGPNIWQQINPNLSTILGSNTNNLVLMNPQTLNNQAFSFNYHQPLVMMPNPQILKSAQVNHVNNHKINQIITPPTASLSITVTKPSESVSSHLNSNSSHNSCVEQLSNSSSSANSKLSFDDKSSCQLSKSHSDNLTDSDQEKSISSPQFQILSNDHNNQIMNGIRNPKSAHHLTVDIDSVSPPSNTFYHQKSISSQNDDRNTIHSPDTDFDQCDFEIPCLYSHKLETNNNEHTRHGDFDS